MRRVWLGLVAVLSCAREPAATPPAATDVAAAPPPAARAADVASPAAEEPMPPTAAPDPATLEPTREQLRRLLESGGLPLELDLGGERLLARDALPAFYSARDLRPAWTDGARATAQARSFVAALDGVASDGLIPADYHHTAIAGLIDSADNPASLARLDLLLTDAFLLAYAHLAVGRTDPEKLHTQWHARKRLVDAGAELERALAAGSVADTLVGARPAYPGYAALVAARKRLQSVGPDGWPQVRSEEQLPARLQASGDLPPDASADDLETALKRFQSRHGLRPGGKLDEATLRALNVPTERRITQIEVNLERWRWLPEDLGARHILVNIAGMDLRYVEDGNTALKMKVVVGKKYRKTPVFSVPIQYLVLNPQWSVPHKIATRDILPKLRKDPGYLAAHRMRVFDPDGQVVNASTIDWDRVNPRSFPYKLWQSPGPDNALGKVKFMFPNAYDVFLHDTNKPGLFTGEQRAASSGCVRLERPLDLAAMVLRGTGSWDRKAIDRAIANGVEKAVYLDAEVWVHLLYWTAWIDDDGAMQFRDDVYGRDRPLLKALDERPPPAHSGL